MRTLSIIIPCYNEERTVRLLLERVSAITIPNWQIEIIVVDDGSTDQTRSIISEFEHRFKIIYHEHNQGKGSAINTGLQSARGDYLIIQDADLEYNPADIPSLVQAIGDTRTQVIYGSRNLQPTGKRGKIIPRLGVWFLTLEFNWLYHTKLTDLWTCYKLFPRATQQYFVPGRFDSELIFSARLAKNHYPISEVPISYQSRELSEGKKIRYRDGLRGIWVLLREKFANETKIP